jgi:hypothetical protein
MKKTILLLFITISVFAVTNCNCQYCTDNISTENEKIPYQNKELVEFTNDTLGSVFDTVYVELGSPSRKAYGCNGTTDSDNELCAANSILMFSNHFYLEISQGTNFHQNEIAYFSNISTFPEKIFFEYKNKLIHASKISFKNDTLGSLIWKTNVNTDSTFIYNDYIFITDTTIKLLQYSTIHKDGTRRIWRLNE